MIRLNKYLQLCGVASRRKADEFIFDKRVKVNGLVAEGPFTRVEAQDRVTLDGELLRQEEKKVYFLLNKPKGYLCTNAPGKKRVIDLFDLPYRLFTVGRLDKDTEGLIIVTNDGDFAQRIIHPSANIDKEYIAQVDRPVTNEHLSLIREGCIVEGTFVKPLLVEKIRKNGLRILLSEGKKREVRWLIAGADLDTVELKRVRIGPLRLGTLPVGHYRELSHTEITFFGRLDTKFKKPIRDDLNSSKYL